MAYFVCRIYKPGSEELRETLRDEHQRHFEKHLPLVLYGGSLKSDDGETGIGNMLVLDCQSRDEVMHVLEGDPFQRHQDIFESVRVQRMDIMIRDGNFEIG